MFNWVITPMRAQILRKWAFFVGKQSVSSQLLVNVTKLFVQKDKYIYIYVKKHMLSYDMTKPIIRFEVDAIIV